MNVVRNEIRTGILATVTLAILAATLIYLGAPALIQGTNHYRIYFEDAGGIQPGASVNLAGRRIGQVRRIVSPVPAAERPRPELVAMIEVEVSQDSLIYREQKVRMVQYSLLADQAIDFTHPNEESGLAPDGSRFIGERQLGLSDIGPVLVEKIDPLVKNAVKLMEDLQKTSTRLAELTADGSDFTLAITGFKKLSENLNEVAGDDGSMRKAFKNLESITAGDSALVEAMNNAKDFTEMLATNRDIEAALKNFRGAAESMKKLTNCLNATVSAAAPNLNETVRNARQFTDTVKRQPWRLIWPSTKKYPEDEAQQCMLVQRTETVPPVAAREKTPRCKPAPSPSPSPKPGLFKFLKKSDKAKKEPSPRGGKTARKKPVTGR